MPPSMMADKEKARAVHSSIGVYDYWNWKTNQLDEEKVLASLNPDEISVSANLATNGYSLIPKKLIVRSKPKGWKIITRINLMITALHAHLITPKWKKELQ